MRIWDNHIHFPRNFQASDPNEGAADLIDHLAERLHACNIVKGALFCGRFGQSHEEALKQAQRYPDLFVPVAAIDPEETPAARIDELHTMGYRGLKIIGAARDYDDPDYFPIYERAEANRMPIVFHCGVIGGPVDLQITHPRYDAKAAERMRGYLSRVGKRNISANRMRPFNLDTIAANFPLLRIVGAHLGGTGCYDEAASVARWRLYVYFDLSGGETIERHAVERGLIGREIAIEKLMFGSDCPTDEIHEHVARFERIFADLKLDDEALDRIWYRNAAEMFGFEEERWAGE